MSLVATYLDKILAAHRATCGQRTVPGTRNAGPPRPFAASLKSSAGLAVIAEVKRRSPSKGAIGGSTLDPALLAKDYAVGGASCISVLTDVEHFGGSPDDLASARAAVDIPVLRKDFTVCLADVEDAYAMGADALLLIVAALDDAELRDLRAASVETGLSVLVEVHDEEELERALSAGAEMVGVNQRDLTTFEVDTERAVRVASSIPDGVVKVAESGVTGPADAQRLYDAGYDAVLVGEWLVRSDDPAAAVRSLLCS